MDGISSDTFGQSFLAFVAWNASRLQIPAFCVAPRNQELSVCVVNFGSEERHQDPSFSAI